MNDIETKIYLALKSRIETCLPDVAKAWPAKIFEPDYTKPYIRVGAVSAAPMRLQIASGKPHDRTGTLILTAAVPLPCMAAVEAPTWYQDQIADHFKDGTKVTYQGVCVSVTEYPHALGGYEDAGWWNMPVSIRWRCFA